MKFLSRFFFFTYIGLVILAGFWGAFVLPHFEFSFLFGMDIYSLTDHERINMMSQYRFLRALELGFGIFSILFIKEIFSLKKFNYLFLTIMGSGILARLASWILDGNPNYFTKFFFFYEALGWLILFFYTNPKLNRHDRP